MFDIEIDLDPEYLKAFNHGYVLAREAPDLFQQLITQKYDHSSYLMGFKEGGKEYVKEQFLERMDKDEREQERDKDRELERD